MIISKRHILLTISAITYAVRWLIASSSPPLASLAGAQSPSR